MSFRLFLYSLQNNYHKSFSCNLLILANTDRTSVCSKCNYYLHEQRGNHWAAAMATSYFDTRMMFYRSGDSKVIFYDFVFWKKNGDCDSFFIKFDLILAYRLCWIFTNFLNKFDKISKIQLIWALNRYSNSFTLERLIPI